MKQLVSLIGAFLSVALLAACGASGYGGGVPGAASPSQDAVSNALGSASTSKLSGKYSGTEKENGASYPVLGSLAQYENAVGGEVKVKKHTSIIFNHVVFKVNGTKLTGINVSPSTTAYCTFSEKATYNARTHVLSGSFKAVYGCSGDAGTYTMKQNCYYKDNPTADFRPVGGLRPC